MKPDDLQRFFKVCNPAYTIDVAKAEDKQYYIDFSSVRGGEIIEELARSIAIFSPNESTCQLFTGHIGCGKSTELLRLKKRLEDAGFHVVYFESSQDLDMADVDISDILLAIAKQVFESLEAVEIKLKPRYFERLFGEVKDFMKTPIDLSWTSEFSTPIGKITAKTKDNPSVRKELRQYLEPRTDNILESINDELLKSADEKLKQAGKKGLVVLVDNLDRVDSSPKVGERMQPEYLFIDRGEQLRRLNCHLVYTIPLGLIFSNEYNVLVNRMGGGVDAKVLPMVPVQSRDGKEFSKGMELLREMVLVRAFPKLNRDEQINSIAEVFDSLETLDRLCRVSGGHVRNLLGLLYSCIQKKDPPIGQNTLETVIKERRNQLMRGIKTDDWELLRKVKEEKTLGQGSLYQTLLRSMFVFEYRDDDGPWFDLNPILADAKQLNP
ncbi:AAA family ATPase [Planktothrix sp. FACHB-1355]|uniref:AAA family ATPase n=1 Tax=Aerosakkonema funiforme FACHB-1375 TaxID=2949571 RepID=A0A926ZK91_9CYAN|nr:MULTISPECIES: P-loop NTPase fold protein [Oscillatoriales]MBD2185152.1 AAA family ATPase [Aerosakkonema funiforme FACHB-1375]MBD3560540.1 AAA family ATPase [Planktothrix sp. FACHB-1355]